VGKSAESWIFEKEFFEVAALAYGLVAMKIIE
jgi:hypothetical protein